ncbi:MAG: acyltransferase [Synechococcus sp.]|nr:acyltransferase [Synechococcus sp.]
MKTIPNLDLARAFAILVVVCGHAGNWVEQIPDKIRFILYAGQYGVELFYALSGYLVGRIFFSEYFRNGSINFAHFLVKRGTRIIPPYLIALLISYGGSLVFEGEQFRVEYLLLIQNYIYSMPFFLASWALCIEAHFYLLFPVLYVILDKLIFKNSKLWSIIAVSCIIFFPLAARVLAFQSIELPIPWGFYLTATHLHYDAIAFGVLAGYISHKKLWSLKPNDKITAPVVFFLLFTTSLSIHAFAPWIEYEFGPSIIGLLCAATVLCLAEGKQSSLSSNSAVKILAKTSFAIYLFHGVSLHALNFGLHYLSFFNSNLLKWLLMVAASILTGLIFYRFVEKPVMLQRQKLLAQLFPNSA